MLGPADHNKASTPDANAPNPSAMRRDAIADGPMDPIRLAEVLARKELEAQSATPPPLPVEPIRLPLLSSDIAGTILAALAGMGYVAKRSELKKMDSFRERTDDAFQRALDHLDGDDKIFNDEDEDEDEDWPLPQDEGNGEPQPNPKPGGSL